jgi:hypothetical protein
MPTATLITIGSPLVAAILALTTAGAAQAELPFLPPVKATPHQVDVVESDTTVRLTPTLWQATQASSDRAIRSKSGTTNEVVHSADRPTGDTSDQETIGIETDGAKDDAVSSDDSGELEPDVPAVPGTFDPSEAVLLDQPDSSDDRAIDVFRFRESSWTWTLRGADLDGIGMFTLGDDQAWELEFDAPAHTDITFKHSFNFVSGPSRPGSDLPERLYDFGWNVRYWSPEFISGFDQNIGLDVNFDFGIHSDFEDSARDGWRFPGRVLLVGETDSQGMWWAAGFEYLDLDHIQMLPAGGLIIRDDNTHLALFFPRPRLRVRVGEHELHDDWLYVLGEYRGRAWAIERSATGLADVATLSEYRLAIGLESEPTRRGEDADDDGERRISFAEVSWLFGRDLEYRSGLGNLRPHDTVMFRIGSRW